MKCEHIEQLIPLYVGGDLEPPEADDLRHHLTGCALCRRLNEEFQASHTWLSTFAVPEFDEASFATLRASVLSQIERQEKRGSWIHWLLPKWNPRLVLAVSTAALVAVTALSVAVYRKQIAPPKKTVGNLVAETGIPVSTGDGQSVTLAENRLSSNGNSTATGGKRRFPGSKTPEPALPEEALNNGGLSFPLEPPVTGPEQAESETTTAVEPEDKEPKEMLRIELQTADPNIRIIWLTPKSAPTESNTK
ncbi:MAG: zf-HC2 domain-containing protein [Acidobacteriota bacterium]|nr:zf-HC2 domain-containing protein [Acidobacteriota bacterium]